MEDSFDIWQHRLLPKASVACVTQTKTTASGFVNSIKQLKTHIA
jgi:hypothetical protein